MFIITKWTKHITDSGKDEYVNKKPNNLNHKFRLKDDDEIIYAYGYSDDDSSFKPLDQYMYEYGCTIIEYKSPKTGEWEVL